LFDEYKGAFAENYVVQQLISSFNVRAYYWRSEGNAEVDFLTEYGNKIIPLEVKSGINPRSKSMKVYIDKNNPDIFYRSSLLNLKKDGRIINIPLYALSILLYSE